MVENSVFSCGVRLVPDPVEFVFPVMVMVTPEAVKKDAFTSTKLYEELVKWMGMATEAVVFEKLPLLKRGNE